MTDLADVTEFYPIDCDPHEVADALERMWHRGFELFDKLVQSVTPEICPVTNVRTMLYRYSLVFRRRKH